MCRSKLYCLHIYVLLFLSFSVHAATDTTPYWTTLQAKQAYTDPYWLKLMYYKKNDTSYISDVSNRTFFLSTVGYKNPEEELHAFLEQLFAENASTPDANIACTYPARAAWVREQLQLNETLLPIPACPRLQTWLDGIRPKYTTLVFSSGFVNNPSSMYGHTLLRIDPNEDSSQRLVSYAINYAALSNKETGMKYAYKGLTGGFDGGYSLVPYYEKVREYGAAEHRDLWEYELNLTPAETLRLMQHFWELRFVHFPYYYININCSYQLLALLDIARPGLELRKHFRWMTIPTDTLRVTLDNTGLLKNLHFRPAQSSILATQINSSSKEVINVTKQLLNNPNKSFETIQPTLTSKVDQARSLSLAADILYQKHKKEASDKETKRNDLLILMQRRSQLDVPATDVATPMPAVDPSKGHKTRRIMGGIGYIENQVFGDLEFRPTYHDVLDPAAGYQDGAEISLLRTRLRADNTGIYLKTFEAVEIQSMDRQNSLQKPKSWGIAAGLRESDSPPIQAKTHPTVSYGTGNIGITLPIENTRCYTLLTGEVEAGKAISKGWNAGTGVQLGCLYNHTQLSAKLELKSLFWLSSEHWKTVVTAGMQVPINTDNAIRFMWQNTLKSALQTKNDDEVLVSWIRYF